MFEYKINICHGNKDALFSKTVARLSCNIHAVWFCTVYNNLQASGINKLLDILKAADVSTCADFDLDIAVDIFDGMDIDDKDYIRTLGLISMLSYDIFVKKILIEKLIDSLPDSNSAEKENEKDKKTKDKNKSEKKSDTNEDK